MLAAGEVDIVANYTYWFFVTANTVGYGDYAPSTSFGRFVAVMIMLLGIGTITFYGYYWNSLLQTIYTLIDRRSRYVYR